MASPPVACGSAAARAPLLSADVTGALTHEEAPTEVPGPTGRVRHRFTASDIFFNSAGRIMAKALEPGRTLRESDGEDLLPVDVPVFARDQLRRAWEESVRAGRPSVAWSIVKVWWPLLLVSAVLHGVEVALNFVSPLLIRWIVETVDDGSSSVTTGMLYAVGYALGPLFQSMFMCHFILHCRRVGSRAWGALSCMVFEKTLRMSQPAAVSYGAGKITNIMQVDTTRFDFTFFWLNFLWSMPCMLVVGIFLLFKNIGPAAFSPMVIMAAMYFMNKWVIRRLMDLSREASEARDARVKVLTEVMHALRLIKLLAWERQVADFVKVCRDKEMRLVAEYKTFGIMNGFIWGGVPLILPVVTFGAHILLGGTLEPGIVFSSLALLDMIRIPMNLFPQATQVVVGVRVGMVRIEGLLLVGEIEELMLPSGTAPPAEPPVAATFVRASPAAGCAAPAAKLVGATFRWADAPRESDQPRDENGCNVCCRKFGQAILRRGGGRAVAVVPPPDVEQGVDASALPPSLRVPAVEILAGRLVFVCGKVGAGKSTLIAGMLNEVPLLEGYAHICGPVAYCSQKPWIMHGTVKENLLFGGDEDPARLEEVIGACALSTDLKELRDGIETVIGERGINLSGGQKARVSLGRAAYQHTSTKTYVLDDPLSAVDMHVAKHLMDECLGSERGLLRHTTRILVTHQLQYISRADLVVVVKDGTIAACKPPSSFTIEEFAAHELDTSHMTDNGGASSDVIAGAVGAGRGAHDAPEPSAHGPPSIPLMRQISASSDVRDVMMAAPLQGITLEAPTEDADDLSMGPARLLPAPRRQLLRSTSHSIRLRLASIPLVRSVSEPAESSHMPTGGGELVTRRAADAAPAAALSAPEAEERPADAGRQQDVETPAPQAGARAVAPPARRADEEEERRIGALDAKVWLTFARAMGVPAAVLLLLFFATVEVLNLAATLYLAQWTAKPTTNDEALACLGIYALMLMGGVVSQVARQIVFRMTSLRVSRKMHDDAMWCVLRSPMSWLDVTPTGRVINRFSQDLQKVDMEAQAILAGFIVNLFSLLVSMGTVLFYAPYILLVVLPLMVLYNRIQVTFRNAARELQRLVSRSKSPIYQGVDEAIIGVASIRAYEKQPHFIRLNCDKTLLHISLQFNLICCNRWFCIRLRLVGTIPVLVVSLVMILQSRHSFFGHSSTGAEVGLVLRYALTFASCMEGFLQSLTSTEQCLVAIERLDAYAQLQAEPPLQEADDATRTQAWPSRGEVSFEGVTMRYREDLPTVLNNISFVVPGGTSLGVVGRTGAGKSSLLQALFRMCTLESGRVVIDGIDTATIGIHSLRRRLAIIPQDPVGFTGTLKFNLDPFCERTEDELWDKLREVQLEDFFRGKDEGLNFRLAVGGENLSVGQMQLVCAARAFLRRARILILDEATASVDFKTDNLIQEVLRQEVTTNHLTTITIAHRINTIIGADNVLVMERGAKVEMGPPKRLAADRTSRFYTFVNPEAERDS